MKPSFHKCPARLSGPTAYDRAVFRFLRRLAASKRRRPIARPLQGEEYEIELAQREARRKNERFAENLIQKAGRGDNPFVENPFDDDSR